MTAAVEIHELQFHKSRTTGWFRAVCSCGAFRVGPPHEEPAIRSWSATHDLDWQPADAVRAPETVSP